jgi:hypothetical protein
MAATVFCERLTAMRLLRLALARKPAFYGTKSIAARALERLLATCGVSTDIRKLDFGDVEIAPHIRRRAYETAERYLDRLHIRAWADDVSGILSIDCELIARKFFFDELYLKYEFLEIALRYALEHPDETHVMYADRQFLEPYHEQIEAQFTVRQIARLGPLGFVTILLLPLFLRYLWRRDGIDEKAVFHNQIVCEIDSEKIYEMFDNLFQSCPSRAFVIERRNIGEFSEARRRELHITSLGLTREDYLFLRAAVYRYIGCCMRHYGDVSRYGGQLFGIFYTFVLGRAETIRGTDNRFVTHEHLFTTKAVRNEFLRTAGNTSIFVPMNAHASPQFFHSEIFINYDVMCAAGKHTEDLYRKRRAVTRTFPPTGSYDNHRRTTWVHDKAERIARLNAFKGDAIAVTIVSPGICDPTYSHELKLMKLARELSKEEGVKVIIRTKPWPPLPKYAAFYETQTAGHESILLTGSDYELFDFPEVTDLFVTSISNAACDMALCDGQVMFVDYMQDPDLFLYWSVIGEALLTEEGAFAAIMAWVRDAGSGYARLTLRKHMEKLTSYLGYRFPSFDAYRANLLRQLHLEAACSA